MISGVLDRLVPPYVANDFARTRSTAAIALVDIQGAGHFDLVMPGSRPSPRSSRQSTTPSASRHLVADAKLSA